MQKFSKESNAFLKWTLQGIAEFPADDGLQQILREYLRSELELTSASKVLLACSKALPGGTFYRVTEQLWDRLLRGVDFASFAKLLAACESNIKHKDSNARVVFYLHLLRRAIWKAPQWSDRVMEFLESRGTELDPSAEQELDFLRQLTEYLRKDRDFSLTAPFRRLLDDMIRAYCEDDWNSAVAKVAHVQDELARSSHEVIEAFPVADNERYYRLFSLCMMVSSDVAEQTAVSFSTVENRHSERQSFAALGDLRDSILPVVKKVQWQRFRSFATPFAAIVILPPVLLFTGLSSGLLLGICSLVWIAVSICVYFMWLKPKILDPRVEAKIEGILQNAYQQQWRSRLFRYVQSCGQAPREAIGNLYEAAEDSGDADWMNVVLSFIRGDIGLIMFGHAQMFVA